MENMTNENKEIIEKNEEIINESNEVKEDKTASDKKSSSNAIKITALVAGGALLGALSTSAILNKKVAVLPSFTLENGGILEGETLDLVFNTHPKEILEFSDYATPVSKKEDNLASKKEWSYAHLLSNGNSLYISENDNKMYEVDSEGNIVNSFDIKEGKRYDYLYINSINETKDNGLLIQYSLGNEDSQNEALFIAKYNKDGKLIASAQKSDESKIIYNKDIDEFVVISSIEENSSKYSISRYSSDMKEISSNDVEFEGYLNEHATTIDKEKVYISLEDAMEYTSKVVSINNEGHVKDELSLSKDKSITNSLYKSKDTMFKTYSVLEDDNKGKDYLSISNNTNTRDIELDVSSTIEYVNVASDGYTVVLAESHESEKVGDNTYTSTLYKVVKYDNDFNELWSKTFGNLFDDNSGGYMEELQYDFEKDSLTIEALTVGEDNQFVKLNISFDKNGNIK